MNAAFDSSINLSLGNIDDHLKYLIEKDRETVSLDLYQDSTAFKYSTDYKHAFVKKDVIKFPKKMSTQIARPNINYKLGFLTAINYVWLTIDNSLLLWNFKATTSEVFEYVCSEPIESVELITLTTHNELLLSTKSYIFLHTLDQIDKEKLRITSKISIRSNGVIMSNVITTDTNRAFMKGSDGHLYELNIVCNENGKISQSKLICHTANCLLSYLPSFFKSVPSESVKSFAVDNQEKVLYLLLSDSSIHVINIRGNQYLPQERYIGKQLSTIHLVSAPHLKKTKLMAVANNGDRLFFACDFPTITLKYTCTAPPLPGSLIFNKMANEQVEFTFYREGIFAAILCKSETTYFILTGSSILKTSDNKHVILDDVYYETSENKIWSIMEMSYPCSMANLQSLENPVREFSVLTKSGITQYIKQRPVDYLEEVLCSERPDELLKFTDRYGLIETAYLAYVLATKKSQKAIEFLCQPLINQDGLLLYFIRTISSIWNMDISQKEVFDSKLSSIQDCLKSLVETIHSTQIPVKKANLELIIRSIEIISLLSFIHHLEWDKLIASIPEWNKIYTFADLVTTNNGEHIAQSIVFAATSHTKLADASNNFSYISNFIESNCLYYFGKERITYFKGVECLNGNFVNDADKQKAMELSLNYFKSIIYMIDFERIKALSQRFYELNNYDGAIQLVFAKYNTGAIQLSELQTIFFSIIENAFLTKQEGDAKEILVNALNLTDKEEYHYMFYNWLINNKHKLVLVELETPLLEKFIKTQIPDESESLACLHHYHVHHKHYTLAIECLYQIAVIVPNVELQVRIECLRTACSYLDKVEDIKKERADHIKNILKIAEIQQNIYNTLIKQEHTKTVAKELEKALVQEDKLFHQYICAYSLYEEGLYLMDVIELYDWKFAKTAWTGIIEASSKSEDEVYSKIDNLAKRLYPSISSFPVYIIFQILQDKCDKYGQEFAESVLLKAGVPVEVVTDAKTLNY
ncbi:Nup133 N terminal like-domain-containing protein [Cokeromyces recurvatus]|uniref:Nup133 N terminal like-domain-containing protein n=1 Tax=Cokeromyces recurvatus TaxID=90255 RepID=UPI00221EDFBF|nr:Nup133 N terminal like-domain-containing protein [Cokeromyces recurvatus]KAI7903615.1 Nup133 N terminal like-domain-containing protein [Cokeromyces recurvatus]